MELNTFINQFEESIDGVEANTLMPETNFKEISQWDSLATLSILAMIDSEYGVEITADELAKCSTILDLFNNVESKNHN